MLVCTNFEAEVVVCSYVDNERMQAWLEMLFNHLLISYHYHFLHYIRSRARCLARINNGEGQESSTVQPYHVTSDSLGGVNRRRWQSTTLVINKWSALNERDHSTELEIHFIKTISKQRTNNYLGGIKVVWKGNGSAFRWDESSSTWRHRWWRIRGSSTNHVRRNARTHVTSRDRSSRVL